MSQRRLTVNKLTKIYLEIVQPLIDTGLFTKEEMLEGVEEKLEKK
jgi:hypothetical protein